MISTYVHQLIRPTPIPLQTHVRPLQVDPGRSSRKLSKSESMSVALVNGVFPQSPFHVSHIPGRPHSCRCELRLLRETPSHSPGPPARCVLLQSRWHNGPTDPHRRTAHSVDEHQLCSRKVGKSPAPQSC